MVHRKESDFPKGFNDLKLKQAKEIAKENFKFLVISNNNDTREDLVKKLTELGYLNVESSHTHEAMEKLLSDESINFIIAPWQSMYDSLWKISEKLKENERLIELPVIILSGESAIEDIKKFAMAEKNYSVLRVPFKMETLKEKIDNLLSFAFG